MEQNNFSEKEQVIYSTNDEPIVLSKSLLDILLKEKDYSDLLALYAFYYYTAKWQKTNQPKATTEYVQKAINWGRDKVKLVKRRLRELELIEDITTFKDNKTFGHFIKVNFIWSKNHLTENTVDGKFPTSRISHLPENTTANALSSNNINALSSNNIVRTKKVKKISPKEIKNKKYLPFAKKLSEIIQTQKQIKHTPLQIKAWSNEFRRLEQDHGVSFERMDEVLFWYSENIGGAFVPVVESGTAFREKFGKLEDAIKRSKANYNKPVNGSGSHITGVKVNYRESDEIFKIKK